MNEYDGIRLVALVGWLVLALSAVAAVRMNWKQGARLALIWIVIFGGVAILFSYLA